MDQTMVLDTLTVSRVTPQVWMKTSIVKGSAGVSNGNIVIHTVTANTIFYLVGGNLFACSNAASKAGTAFLEVDTAGDGVFRQLARLEIRSTALVDSQNAVVSLALSVPIPISAGSVIRVRSDDAGIGAMANIVGWEE